MKPRMRRTLLALALLPVFSLSSCGRSSRQMIYPEPRTGRTLVTKAPVVRIPTAPGKAIPPPSVDVPMLDPQSADRSR